MKKIPALIFSLLLSASLSAQFVARVQLTEPVEGICDPDEIYAIFPMLEGQKEAVCPLTDEEIVNRLNRLDFLQNNLKFKSKGMIGLMINCEGEVVECEMSTKTKSAELDKQIEAEFAELGDWEPAQLDDREVDSSVLFSFRIKKGYSPLTNSE